MREQLALIHHVMFASPRSDHQGAEEIAANVQWECIANLAQGAGRVVEVDFRTATTQFDECEIINVHLGRQSVATALTDANISFPDLFIHGDPGSAGVQAYLIDGQIKQFFGLHDEGTFAGEAAQGGVLAILAAEKQSLNCTVYAPVHGTKTCT